MNDDSGPTVNESADEFSRQIPAVPPGESLFFRPQ
jgi:hypothetical protein